MNSLTALFSRISRVVFILGIAFLATTLAGVILAAASRNDGAPPVTHFADNGASIASVKVALTGSQSGVRITDNNGNHSFEVPGDGNYPITPSLNTFAFIPVSRIFNNL